MSVAWVGAGIAAVAAIAQSDASRKASNTQKDAANASTTTQLGMYDQTRADQAPWREAGMSALNKLNAGIPDWKQDPSYKFGLSEGNRAIENSAAARGGLQSGAALKAAARYGQDYSTNQYDKQWNRLSSLAGLGQTSVGQTGQNAMYTGQAIANNQADAANARASGYMGQANALTGAMNTGLNYYQQQQYLDKMNNTKG